MNKQKILHIDPARRKVNTATAKVRKPEYIRPRDEYRRLLVRRVLGVVL